MKLCISAAYKFNYIFGLYFTNYGIKSRDLAQNFVQKTPFPRILNFFPAPPPPHPKLC